MWPDELKQAKKKKVPLKNDPEAKKFNIDFPKNGGWHFVNFPLGSASYQLNGPFSRQDDIVHIIEECVKVLEGNSTRFTKRQALRFLVHLVGDIHQPLHVGCGYFQFDDENNALLVTDPAAASGLTHDTGGNVLFFDRSKQLHSFWDSTLVERVAGNKSVNTLADLLGGKVDNPAPAWKTLGNYHLWARLWATDSVVQSREAYRGLSFRQALFEDEDRLLEIETTLPSNYGDKNEGRATEQLAKAGFHLKELLNNIKWK